MLQADAPDDYVIATGESHSVREFCELAFKLIGRPITWRGSGLDEVGVDAAGNTLVKIDPRYFRPAEVDEMKGDASYAREKLGWKPRVTFAELVRLMVEADAALVRGGGKQDSMA
jgi:GDPmannose 4,6-dehydratase